MNKKFFWLLIISLILLLIIFPFITNALMFIKTIPVAGDESVWIGYIGTFAGAIIGGVISGALTLIGVNLTIKNEEEIRKINEYPKKINSLENLINKIDDNLKEIDKYTWVKEPYDINTKDELRLFEVDRNLEIKGTHEYEKLTDTFLKSIKEDILGIDAKWYKDFFQLRMKLSVIINDFSHNQRLIKLCEEAQDYYLEDFDPTMSWRKYAETIKKDEYSEIYKEIVSEEFKIIHQIYSLLFEFKNQAEIYQLKLLQTIK